ncbi:aspartate carbamoyltransferase regulatory subunit [Methanococcoides sp. FTZ1]|uniref:aspartate carbamoyltransferase regulatory subunit n=1 Tax=Methanococcoides sp. FTZ1 TaxID=3439061 RepID=UPI003F84FD49
MSIDDKPVPEIRVHPIRNGTVIDHITAGQALKVLNILNIPNPSSGVISIIINAPSVHGIKDVVKIEGRELNLEEVDKISLISPKATINIIRDFVVSEKTHVHIPEVVDGVVKCINPNCISNSNEPVSSKFTVSTDGHKIILRCLYCERIISEDIGDHLL